MTLTEGVRERERDREIEIWIVTMGMRGVGSCGRECVALGPASLLSTSSAGLYLLPYSVCAL